MKNDLKIGKKPIAVLLGLVLLFAFASCEKETLQPKSAADARLQALAEHFDKDMDEAEFKELYTLVSEKTDAALAGKPALQADVSNREYALAYSNQVRIEVGGAVYFKCQNEVRGGTTVGGVTLPPELFAQLDAAAGHKIRLRIRGPFDWTHYVFGLRQVIMTVVDQGNAVYYGLYNVNSKDYLFLNAGGGGNASCVAIGLGRVAGNVAAPYANITQGEISNGLIVGCGPILIGASITFFYSGVETP